MLGQLSLPPTLDLKPHDFRELWREKKSAHLQGTREWAFAEILKWLDDPASPQLFWLMGGGGTGKTVLTAELLERVIERTVAWHFCRHDNPAQSAPGSLLRSLAAMLAHRLPGYREKLEATGLPGEAVDDPAELFKALLERPLLVSEVQAPERPLLVIIDALDELPKESQKPLLDVIAIQLSRLPPWLKLFVTSREEPQIKRALSSFKPKELRADEAKNRADVEVKELRADEAKNRADVEVYLRTIARQHIKGEANIANIEAAVKLKYGIDMKGKLAGLQTPMDLSKAVYAKVREKLRTEEGYEKLIAEPEKRNDNLVQVSDDLDTVHVKQAPEAQKKLELLIADKWEADPNKATLRHPVQGTARAWVEFADSPGIKKEPRVSEKMKNDYGGHANKLKDLARLTLRFSSCSRMAHAIAEGLQGADIEVLTLKNKYASPTPMGYSDFNLCAGVVLSDGTRYVCEIQLNHIAMLKAKDEAHVYYEAVRKELPALCQGRMVNDGELTDFIVGRLSTSSLDAAVEALSAEAEGLFLYAYMLGQHLESEAKKQGHSIHFKNLDSLPAGLMGEVYAVNFKRAFPKGQVDPAWTEAKPFVQLIAAAREPITVAMAAALLGWDDGQQGRVLETTALLFPVRDDKVHVFHKTIVDWLTGEITEGSSIREPSAEFKVQRKDGHAMLAEGFIASRTATPPEGRALDEWATYYWLQYGISHLCRANGQGAKAARVFATDLALLRERVDRGLLPCVAKDYLELKSVEGVDLTDAIEMWQFVCKSRDVLQRDKGAAVMQLALQQPDASAVFRAGIRAAYSQLVTVRALMSRHFNVVAGQCRVAGDRDRFGNVKGNHNDLGRDGAFEGSVIGVIQLYSSAKFDFSLPRTALEEKGFRIKLERSVPRDMKAFLADCTQLWVISTSVVQFNAEQLAGVKAFWDSGKGVAIWGDNEPYYADANAIMQAMLPGTFTVMHGNVRGGKQVQPNSTGSGPGFPQHLVTTGIENLYEGNTIATITHNGHKSLTPLIYGSAGNLVATVFDDGKRRAIFDGAFTRLYHSWDAAGSARYVKNLAAWLDPRPSRSLWQALRTMNLWDSGALELLSEKNLDSLKGLGEVYAVSFKRTFPKGQVDPAWTEAKPFVQLIAAAREPITVAMAAALLGWDDGQQERVLETTALLFPVRDDKVHVFHKTIVDWLTGEITEGSSIREPSAEFKVQRNDGHAMLAEGFIASRTATPPEGRALDEWATYYWLQYGISHLCRANGQGAKAAFTAQAAHYAIDLALLRERVDRGLLSSVYEDYLELQGVGVDLTDVTEMLHFVGKYMDVLQRDKGAAVMQLALQQPDASAVFCAGRQLLSMQPARALMWRNKSQEKDACIGTLPHKEAVSSVAVGATRIVSGSGNSIFVYDAESQELIKELRGTSRVMSVTIWDGGKDGGRDTNQSKSLIVAGFQSLGFKSGIQDGTIQVWDSSTLELMSKRTNAHSDWIRSVAFSLDGTKIVSGSDDKTIKVWDAVHFRPHGESEWETFEKQALALEPKMIKVLDSGTLGLLSEKTNAHSNYIRSVAFSPDGTKIVSGSDDKTIKVWDSGKLEMLSEKTNAHSNWVRSVVFSPDGTKIVSGSDDQTIKVWDSGKLELISEKTIAHSDYIRSVAFSPDGTKIVSGSDDQTIKVWNLGKLELLSEKTNAHSDWIMSVAFSPDGTKIVSGSDNKKIKVWDSSKLELLSKKTSAHSAWVRSVAFSPDGTKIVSGSDDLTIKVWDSSKLELISEKTNAHSEWITSVAFSPDGTKIVSGSDDNTIKVWDADSFNLLETRPGEAMAFSEEAEGVVRDGETIRMKDGGGAFYAPSPISCLAVSWPRIAAGAQSGELYHLEAML